MTMSSVIAKCDQFKIQHVIMLLALFAYCLIGAMCFVLLEGATEEENRGRIRQELLEKRLTARKLFYEDIKERIPMEYNRSLNSGWKQLRIALVHYDKAMGFNMQTISSSTWTMWDGLYFIGTVCTTIGYGDIVPKTFSGRIFTIIFAIFGIPLVISLLNELGNISHGSLNLLYGKGGYVYEHLKWSIGIYQSDQFRERDKHSSSTDTSAISLKVAIATLIGWILFCSLLFYSFEDWSLFECIYFFFISLTTIGFGDYTVQPKIAVCSFVLVLIGLSIVSMSINIIQDQISKLFGKVAVLIDDDFRKSLEGTSMKQDEHGVDVCKEYDRLLASNEKFLIKLMDKHRKQLLNETYSKRARMQNAAVQTNYVRSAIEVQTDEIGKSRNVSNETPEVKRHSMHPSAKSYIYTVVD